MFDLWKEKGDIISIQEGNVCQVFVTNVWQMFPPMDRMFINVCGKYFINYYHITTSQSLYEDNL